MKVTRFAVIGAGHMGKRHAEMISREQDGELVAMVDIRSKEECGAMHFDVPFFSTMEESFPSGIEFDVVNVCTPMVYMANKACWPCQKKHVSK